MRTKLLTLRFHAALGGFDSRPLDDFLRDKELVAIRDHFFVTHETAYLACLLTYEAATAEPPANVAAPTAAKRGVEPETLPLPERALFATLREWRSERARRDGVPPYIILTNRELLAVVQQRPSSPTELAALPGIGPGKTEKYGAAILARVQRAATAAPATESQPALAEAHRGTMNGEAEAGAEAGSEVEA